MPYSPIGPRWSVSVTGTLELGPCTQIVPQCSSSDVLPRSPRTSCSAAAGVKQVMSTTTSALSPAMAAGKASAKASRSNATRFTELQASSGR